MRIEEGNANKMTKINKRFSISIIPALVIFMISGSAATMTYATPQMVPTCVDPTSMFYSIPTPFMVKNWVKRTPIVPMFF
jgi:hypothetical protein